VKLAHLERALPLLLFAFTVLAFWPALHADFVFVDDGAMLLNNPHIYSGLTWDSAKWAFQAGHWGMWMPLTWLSHQLDVTLFGLYPEGPHLEGVLLHATSAVIAWFFLKRATGDTWRSLLVALLFATHPMRAESVVWVSERKDVLCVLFSVAALERYVAYRKGPTWPRWLAVTGLYACALMSKGQAVTLPFVMLLLDYWPLTTARNEWKRRALEKLPWLAMAAGSAVLTMIFQKAIGAVTPAPLWERAQHMLGAYGLQLWHTVWPQWLSYFYPRITPPLWSTALSLLALCGLAFIAWRLRKSHPSLAVGLAWFLGVMFPTTGVIQVGGQLTADRYSYLPHLGLFMGIVFALPKVPEQQRRAVLLAAGALVFASVGVLWGQALAWNDSSRLYAQALRRDPDSPRTLMYMGMLKLGQSQIDEAVPLLEHAAEVSPNDGYARSNLARAYEAAGRHEEALAAAEAATHLPVEGLAQRGFVLQAYGKLLIHSGRLAEAEVPLRQAVALQPELPVELDLARLLIALHRDDEALSWFESGGKHFPRDKRFREEAAALRQRLGRPAQ
jgi:tetratricopeptide (TPR) repeat protein